MLQPVPSPTISTGHIHHLIIPQTAAVKLTVCDAPILLLCLLTYLLACIMSLNDNILPHVTMLRVAVSNIAQYRT